MDTYEDFEQDLRQALARLYDPTLQPSETLRTLARCSPSADPRSVQEALLRAIEQLKPGPDVPPHARSWRIYHILSCRYVEQLTQDETAEHLNISPRHLRREQQVAVAMLARSIWRQTQSEAAPGEDPVASEPDTAEGEALSMPGEWHSQVRQELASLRRSAPGMVADVEHVLRSVASLVQPLAGKHGVTLIVEAVTSDLVAAMHPSHLRQALVGGVSELTRCMTGGQIRISAEHGGNEVRIQLVGQSAGANAPPQDTMLQELLTGYGETVHVSVDGPALSISYRLPSVRPVTVLVVDDNADLLRFFERYVQGTRYRIVSTRQGERLFDLVEETSPDIIVLDVMLPDVDGWELLVHLHDHPATRLLPIVVCSVIRERELSLTLGATCYVPKPVGRHEFLEALDSCL